MYPFFRLFKDMAQARRAPKMGLFETHVSHHLCMPWDLDMWNELNNGRTLTLYDLGRMPLAMRTGLAGVLRRNRWGIVVAGASIRYRRRVQAFQRFEMRSRCVGWDNRFLYMDQSMWRNGECSSQVLIRGAVTSSKGMVPPERLLEALGSDAQSPPLPAWVQGWIDADNTRPWPPEA